RRDRLATSSSEDPSASPDPSARQQSRHQGELGTRREPPHLALAIGLVEGRGVAVGDWRSTLRLQKFLKLLVVFLRLAMAIGVPITINLALVRVEPRNTVKFLKDRKSRPIHGGECVRTDAKPHGYEGINLHEPEAVKSNETV
ncbi:hypothetical protein, partial [Yinghuangia sp. YIM S10712]|uniref:hypothetical protein n=1 Tax=Yinghuangia sp. YIM S10712 TaxID=3436930 RepID=UPI003F532147